MWYWTNTHIAMENYTFYAEDTSENFEEKTLCVFVLDTSGSMEIGDNIGQLNRGIAQFFQEIASDHRTRACLEVGIITFSSDVTVYSTPRLVEEIPVPTFQASGLTQLVGGIQEAIKMVGQRKAYYKDRIPYKRPFIILLTDGAPYPDGQDIEGVAKEIHAAERDRHFVFLPIGFADADMSVLRKLSPRPPKRLDQTKFSEFFEWLGNSMREVSTRSAGESIPVPPTSSWESFDF